MFCIIESDGEKIFRKLLDRVPTATLYKSARAMMKRDGDNQMMSRTHKQQSAKRQARASMRVAWCSSLSLSPTNLFGGQLGQETSIVDSRYIRH
jgi:hypothetical protein